ncbi:hypothetical protein V8E54_011089 [Elaphomyces granulatus]
MQDDGEVELWEAIIIGSGDEEDDKGSGDEDGLTVIENAEVDKVRQLWKEEGLQNKMIETKTCSHEGTMCRHRQKEREHAKHVVGMGRIDSMMRRMAQLNESKGGHEAVDGGDKEVVDIQVEDIIEVLTYENQEGKVEKKMNDDLERLLHMLRSKRYPVAGQDKERYEMVRDFMRMKLKNWGMSRKECSAMGKKVLLRGLCCGAGNRYSSVVAGGGTERRIGYDGEEGRKVSIQAWTAREWLNRMGYRWKSVSKGAYINGHEREDVVQYRK